MALLPTLRFILDHPLNQGRRLPALTRFLRWQIGSRVLPFPHVMPFIGKTVLVMERGMTGATGNWYCGLHEFSDMAFTLHFLRPEDLFADIGANVGSYTVLASGVTGARSVSFEPIPKTFSKLARNIAANNLDDLVRAYNIGLSGREEVLQFTSGRDTVNHVVADGEMAEHEDTVSVSVRRLDDVLAGEVPSLVKIDVEGWEAEVLDGMSATLAAAAIKAVITETNQSSRRYAGGGDDRVAEVMRKYDFIPCTYDPFTRTMRSGGSSGNTIFTRDVDFVRKRLETAPDIRVFGKSI